MKWAQVFTIEPKSNADNCEIDAALVSYKVFDGCLEIKTKEEDATSVHLFPLSNLAMVRIFDAE